MQITKSGSVTFSVKGILSFHTYNSLNGLVSYYSDRRQDVVLRGGGMFTTSEKITIVMIVSPATNHFHRTADSAT